MFTFITHMTAAPGKGPALQALLSHVSEQSRGEPGVIYYGFAVSADDPDRHVVIEVYRDQAAQASHLQTAWVQDSIPKTMPLIEGIEIKQYVSPGAEPIVMRLPDGLA